MNITELLTALRAHPDKAIQFMLPDGILIAAHFHITEVGHVLKRFIDCGGTRRTLETCMLQTWVHDDIDHRLFAGKLAKIFDLAEDIIPHHELPVEIEYEDGVVAQFPVEGKVVIGDTLIFRLGTKHTDCLARGICIPGECAPTPKEDTSSCCTPGSKCC